MTTIVRTAGMVQGTPDWQLDRMYEAECARKWEEQNKEDSILRAIEKLNDALSLVFKAESRLGSAADKVNGTPMDDKIMSVLDTMELLEVDISRLKNELCREVGI